MITYYAIPHELLTEIVAEKGGHVSSTWWLTRKTITLEFLLLLIARITEDLEFNIALVEGWEEQWEPEHPEDEYE